MIVGYPIMITDTTVGWKTKVDTHNSSIVGIGSTFLTTFIRFIGTEMVKMARLQ